MASLRIDLDLADMASIGIAAGAIADVANAPERAGEVAGHAAGSFSGGCDLAKADAGAARCREYAVAVRQRGGLSLQDMSGDRAPPCQQLLHRLAYGDADQAHRPTGNRAAADRHPIGIVGHEANLGRRYLQPFRDELREAGLMSLATTHGPDNELDGSVA